MARTISDIQTQIQNVLVSNMAAIGVAIDPATWSATNILRLLCYVFAFVANVLETIFDTFTADVTAYVNAQQPHTTRWYANMALAFQYGFNLLAESDQFDNSGYTDEQIAASKVVAYSAVEKQTNAYGRVSLRIKLAGDGGDDLVKLPDAQVAAVVEYFNRVGDAGVPLVIDSNDADSLKINCTCYYDPLILNANGDRLDGTATNIVETAIKGYLKQLPFNGTYVLQYAEDAVQALPGVVIFKIDLAQSKYGDFDFSNIDTKIVPDSGYLRIMQEADLVINYVAQSPIK